MFASLSVMFERSRVPLFGDSAALRPPTMCLSPCMQSRGPIHYLLSILPRLLVHREASTTCHASSTDVPSAHWRAARRLSRCFSPTQSSDLSPLIRRCRDRWESRGPDLFGGTNLTTGAVYKDTQLYVPYDTLFLWIPNNPTFIYQTAWGFDCTLHQCFVLSKHTTSYIRYHTLSRGPNNLFVSQRFQNHGCYFNCYAVLRFPITLNQFLGNSFRICYSIKKEYWRWVKHSIVIISFCWWSNSIKNIH